MLAGFARWTGFFTMAAGIVGAVLLAGGFFWFAAQVPAEEVTLDHGVDGIVVLTGAATRIPDAIELLAAGRGKRLLITGVHRDTSTREVARVTPLYKNYFACCIDLDRSALNTFGNALEIKRWAREHNFNSLIVVTSNWHMPRAMAEVAYQLPDVALVAYPVLSERVKADPWWSSPDTARVYVSEYLKFLFANLRMRLDPETST